jgi:hypothetical protein
LENPSYTKLQYRGRPKRRAPEREERLSRQGPYQNSRFSQDSGVFENQYDPSQNYQALNNVLQDTRNQPISNSVVVSKQPKQQVPQKKLHNQQSNPFQNVVENQMPK